MITNRHYNTPNSSLEPVLDTFIARMDILGHKFIIRCNGHLNDKFKDMWFNDITEVLVANGLQIKG